MAGCVTFAVARIPTVDVLEIGVILHIFPSGTESMGDRGSKKAYTGPKTGTELTLTFDLLTIFQGRLAAAINYIGRTSVAVMGGFRVFTKYWRPVEGRWYSVAKTALETANGCL